MAWNETLTALNYRLADLYYTEEDARRVARIAEFDTGDIDFSGGIKTVWFNILDYANTIDKGARNHDLLIALLKTVTSSDERGKKDDFLKTILSNYIDGKAIIESPESADARWQEPESPDHLEKLMSSVNTLLPISFLDRGLQCAQAVVRIDIGKGAGTGFLIQDNYIVTNHHVIPDLATARTAKVQFNFQKNWDGVDLVSEEVSLLPEASPKNFKTDKTLDYTLVKLADDLNRKYGALTFSDVPPQKDDFVNIIQHPAGGPKQIALYHNVVTYADETRVQYLTDTLPGSSGSPVFNSSWAVVALHHSGGWIKEPGVSQAVYRNEGIDSRRIKEALETLSA
ncbi:trypsin-like serine peptidase [Spirosoma aerophilum]